MTMDTPLQIVFIDSRVPDIRDLLAGVQPGEAVYVLDPNSDGLQQIADILAADNFSNLSAISIVSHGSVGEVTLGSTVVTDSTLDTHASALAEIGAALGSGGTLQLFGCDVGQGAAGQQFVNDLAMFAGGVNVAAATHDVGSAALGGSWALDASSAPGGAASPPAGAAASSLPPFNAAGPPPAAPLPQPTSPGSTSAASSVPFTQQALNDFQGVLANPVQTELWITAGQGGPATELLHVDDNGGANSINNTTLWTPSSANRPTQAYQMVNVALDPTNQLYFLANANPGPVTGVPQAANAILKGSLGSELSNPSGTPALTTIYYQSGTLGGPSGTGFISGIDLDTANQQIYFTQRHSILKVGYNGGPVTTLATGGTSVFTDGLALDLPHNQAFFFSNTTFSTSSNGHPIISVSSNAIYVNSNLSSASVVTPTKLTMSPGDTHIGASADFPVSLGLITGIAVDTVSEKLYFTTEPVADPTKFSGTGTGGVYEYDIIANPGHTYTALWVEPSTSSLFLTYIHIDHATNSYYVSDVNSTTGTGLYKGSLSGSGAPTLFTSIGPPSVGMSLNGFALDNAPTLAITAANTTFTESTSNPASSNNTPVSVISSATASDGDNTSVFSATVSIGGFFAGDVLSASTAGTSVTSSYNSTTGVLTLSGVDSFTHYQSVLASVHFTSTSENPIDYGSDASRTLTWSVNDGLLTSAPATATVTVVGVNDAPTLSGVAASKGFTEAAGAVTLSGAVTVFDPDSLNVANATVSIAGGTFAGDGDVLAATTGGTGITASYSSTTETLVLSGSDTLAHYQSVLDSITFNSSSLNPTNYGSNLTRTVTWALNDGSGSFNLSTTQTETVSITAVNNPPTLSGVAGSLSFTEGTAVTLSGAVSVSDPDSLSLQGATVAIAGGTFAGDGDTLTTGVTGTHITASYNSSTETLVLSGSDTLANYQSVLDKVTFGSGSNPDDYGSNPSRTITWVLNDGSGSNNLSTAQTETVSITAINDPPVLSGVAASASFTELGTTTLSGALSVSDPDSLNLANATVRIAGGTFAGDGDTLATSTTGTSITASYNSSTETLVLTGSDSLAHYQSVLDKVTFTTASHNPTNYGSNPTRTLTWLVNDGSASNNLSSVATTTLAITAVDDAPTLAGTAASVGFTENGNTVVLSASLTASDPDNLTLAGATVRIAGGSFAGDGDVLAANTAGTAITASYNAATETLTLSGSDTPANYQQVLDTVTFVTASDNPADYGSNPSRTITWVLNDGTTAGTASTTTVNITAINDAPTLSNVAASQTYTEGGAAAVLASGLTVFDPDNLNLANATVSVTGGKFAGDGDVLAVATAGTSITASYNAASETLTLSGSDTVAHYQQVLDSLTFSSTSHNPADFGSNPTRVVSWQVNDGSGSSNLSNLATTTVSLTALNDAPTLANVATSAHFTEEAGAVTLSNAASVSDPDNLNLANATVSIAGGAFAGDVLAASTAGTSITASYDSANERLVLSGTDTLAHYQSVLDRVTFNAGENPTDFGSDPTRLVTWVLNDGSASSSLSAAATTTVSITNVNDPPTLSNVAALATAAAQTTVTLAGAAAVSDPDNLALVGATVAITGGTFAGDGDLLAADTTGTSITASYDSTTETLTLSGSDTLAHYQGVLDTVTFETTAADPTNAGADPTRTVTWVLNDGAASSNLSAPATTTVSLQTGPAVNPPAHVGFTEGPATVGLAPSLSVTDPSSAHLLSATVAIAAGAFTGDQLFVAGAVSGATIAGTNITATFAGSGPVTLTGSDTLANYQAALDAVSFATSSHNPSDFGSDPARTVTWTVVDDSGTTNDTGTATTTIDITAINDAPTLSSVATSAVLHRGCGRGHARERRLGHRPGQSRPRRRHRVGHRRQLRQ